MSSATRIKYAIAGTHITVSCIRPCSLASPATAAKDPVSLKEPRSSLPAELHACTCLCGAQHQRFCVQGLHQDAIDEGLAIMHCLPSWQMLLAPCQLLRHLLAGPEHQQTHVGCGLEDPFQGMRLASCSCHQCLQTCTAILLLRQQACTQLPWYPHLALLMV